MEYGNHCPGCGKKLTIKTLNTNYPVNGRNIIGVHECPKCKAVFGTCYLGESYSIVKPWMSDRPDMDGARYYDFTVLTGNGIDRRHGWFDPDTRLILQVG